MYQMMKLLKSRLMLYMLLINLLYVKLLSTIFFDYYASA